MAVRKMSLIQYKNIWNKNIYAPLNRPATQSMMSSDNEATRKTESDGENSFIDDGVDWFSDDEIKDREVQEEIDLDEVIRGTQMMLLGANRYQKIWP